MEEKTADEMFEKLGYKKIDKEYYLNSMLILYGNNYDKSICFWNDKTIEVYDFYKGSRNFTMQELQAINKKVEELQWK